MWGLQGEGKGEGGKKYLGKSDQGKKQADTRNGGRQQHANSLAEVCYKRPNTEVKETKYRGSHMRRRIHVIYTLAEVCQKRPNTEVKETKYRGKRDQCQKRQIHRWKRLTLTYLRISVKSGGIFDRYFPTMSCTPSVNTSNVSS